MISYKCPQCGAVKLVPHASAMPGPADDPPAQAPGKTPKTARAGL